MFFWILIPPILLSIPLRVFSLFLPPSPLSHSLSPSVHHSLSLSLLASPSPPLSLSLERTHIHTHTQTVFPPRNNILHDTRCYYIIISDETYYFIYNKQNKNQGTVTFCLPVCLCVFVCVLWKNGRRVRKMDMVIYRYGYRCINRHR